MDEIVGMQTYAGTAAPFDFNGLVRPLLHPLAAADGRDPGQPGREGGARPRPATRSRSRCASGSPRVAVPEGTAREGRRAAARPAGAGDRCSRRSTARTPRPAARWRRGCARPFEAVPFVVDVDDSFGEPAERRAPSRSSTTRSSSTAWSSATCSTRSARSSAARSSATRIAARGVRRSRSSSPGPEAERQVGEASLTTPIPANLLPGDRGVCRAGDMVPTVGDQRGRLIVPDLPAHERAAEMVMAELRRCDFSRPRSTGMLAVAGPASTPWTGATCPGP